MRVCQGTPSFYNTKGTVLRLKIEVWLRNLFVYGTYYNGLSGVTIIPYMATTHGGYDAIRNVPATDSPSASTPAPIYNLHGQRLGTPQRGVNIVGGTKIIVR